MENYLMGLMLIANIVLFFLFHELISQLRILRSRILGRDDSMEKMDDDMEVLKEVQNKVFEKLGIDVGEIQTACNIQHLVRSTLSVPQYKKMP